MTGVDYIENETQLAVKVDLSHGWAPLGVIATVTYPTGHRFAVRYEDLAQHFTQVANQTIQATGSNTIVSRPTEKQLELQEGFVS